MVVMNIIIIIIITFSVYICSRMLFGLVFCRG